MVTVHQWSGREAHVLRTALRLSVRAFAEHLGVGVRTVAKWEAQGNGVRPLPDTQAILDTALARTDPTTQARFELMLAEEAKPTRMRQVSDAGPRVWDYETWTEDIERAVACLSRQNFAFASHLLNRWLIRYEPCDLDGNGLYLYGRSLVLLGDLRRDQGTILGPLSAQQSYADAREMFSELDIPRRLAQTELSLAVVAEMSGQLDAAARRYEELAADERLSRRDRARARLWVGTALSKEGNYEYAARVMTIATREFEDLTEPDDWSVAHQKLALAYRSAGDITRALRCIEVARSTGTVDSPMQRVRQDTAQAHILLSDRATQNDGLSLLDRAARVAMRYGLSHQVRSIESVRRMCEGASVMCRH